MKETGRKFDQKMVSSDNLGQNIWNNVKKSSKIGYD